MHKIQHVARVIANERVSTCFRRMVFDAPRVVCAVEPGQFIHIRVTDGTTPLLRRPFSVYRAKKYIEILFEVVGTGTELLAAKKPGEYVDILGPLGNAFSPPARGTTHIVMIAGGVGIAPFLMLSDRLKKHKAKNMRQTSSPGKVYQSRASKPSSVAALGAAGAAGTDAAA